MQKFILEYAMKFVGLPYRWGGDDPMDGFDCSGLVIEILQAFGAFPHGQDATAQDLYSIFPTKTLSPKLGDLVFFGPNEKEIKHVGFCLNEDLMLEAGGGNSKTKTKEDAAKQNAYVRVRPISIRGDLIAIKRPQYLAW